MAVLDALTGEIAAHMSPGAQPRGRIEIGVARPDALKLLLPMCTWGPGRSRDLQGHSRRLLDTFGREVIDPPLEVAVTIGDKSVVAMIGEGRGDGGERGPPHSLAGERWTFALWARGSLIAGVDKSPVLVDGLADEDFALGVWLLGHVSELAAGVRADDRGVHALLHVATSWRDSPELVAELEPLMRRFVGGDTGALPAIAALGAKHPGSALATDVELGANGLMAVAAGAGVLAGLAVPAFQRYVEASTQAAGGVVVEFEALADKMCGCADRGCAESVNRDFEAWLKRHETAKGSRQQQDKARAIAERYTKCMINAMKKPDTASP